MDMSPLRILYLDTIPLDLAVNIELLHRHLESRPVDSVRIHLYSPIENPSIDHYGFTTKIPQLRSQEAILDYAREQDIDIIHGPCGLFDRRMRQKQREFFLFTSLMSDLEVQVEAYIAGFGIPWLVSSPILNARWIQKYNLRNGLTSKAYQFLITVQNKGASASQVQYARSLLNKAMHIEYSRDLLHHFLVMKKRATRAGHGDYYNFQLTHHLTDFTFSICSAMDVLARYLNDTYSLGYGTFNNYGIEKSDFIDRLSAKRKTLGSIFSIQKYNKWGRRIKIIRNEFTHSSHVYLTQLVIEKEDKDKLSSHKLDELIDQKLAQDRIEAIPGFEELYERIRSTTKFEIELSHNYKKVAEDIMTLEMKDESTGEMRPYIVRPLYMIDDDFKMISEILERSFNNLSKARRPR